MVMDLRNFRFNTIFNHLSDSLSNLYQPQLFSYQVTEMSMAQRVEMHNEVIIHQT